MEWDWQHGCNGFASVAAVADDRWMRAPARSGREAAGRTRGSPSAHQAMARAEPTGDTGAVTTEDPPLIYDDVTDLVPVMLPADVATRLDIETERTARALGNRVSVSVIRATLLAVGLDRAHAAAGTLAARAAYTQPQSPGSS